MRTPEDVYALMPAGATSGRERTDASSDRFVVEHCFYHSRNLYAAGNFLEEITVVRRGQTQYKYNMYIVGYTSPGGFVALVAVPFTQLGREVYERIQKASRGHGLRYQTVNLDRLISAVKAKKHLGGRVKITKLDLLLHGDSAANSVSFAGKDTLHSRVYQRLTRHLSGIEMQPRRCCVAYDSHEGQRFALESDRFGNFAFRITSGAANLPSAAPLLSYLYDSDLIEETTASPLRRGTLETED